jgi:hypothetical protein
VTVGNESKVGRVTTEPILRKWRSIGQIALLAMTNSIIFETVVSCFLTDMTTIESHEGGNPSAPVDVTQSQEMSDDECDEFVVEEPDRTYDEEPHPNKSDDTTAEYPRGLPKFHINSGAASGRQTFRRAFRQIELLFELFELSDQGSDEVTMKLPKKAFPSSNTPKFRGGPSGTSARSSNTETATSRLESYVSLSTAQWWR